MDKFLFALLAIVFLILMAIATSTGNQVRRSAYNGQDIVNQV